MKYPVSLTLILALSACAGMRRGEHQVAPAPAPPPAAVADNSQVAPSPADSGVEAAADAQSAAVATPAPNCSCADVKPTKPRPRPKPKPVQREAPPQLPTAPVVVETPPGAVVNAQVHEMSVSVMSILGKRVKGPNDEDLGRVVDVLADSTGRVRVAIIDFGGFLGVGNHRIAVDWPLLRFNPDARDPSLLLSVNRDKLQAAPEYKDNPRPQALMEPSPAQPAATGTPAVDDKK